MKARLASAPLTYHDQKVMSIVWARAQFIWLWGVGSDRRDADLMLALEHIPGFVNNLGPQPQITAKAHRRLKAVPNPWHMPLPKWLRV